MKTVKLQNTINSADMLTLKIYHTAITSSNLLTSSISQSGVFTGQDLFDGLEFQVEDDVNQFFVENLTLCTNIGSGSLTENSNLVEFFTFGSGDYGAVSIVGSETKSTALVLTTRQNFSINPTLTATVTANYPYVFDSWFSNAALTGSALSVDNPLTLSSGSYTSTSWYPRYRLGNDYY